MKIKKPFKFLWDRDFFTDLEFVDAYNHRNGTDKFDFSDGQKYIIAKGGIFKVKGEILIDTGYDVLKSKLPKFLFHETVNTFTLNRLTFTQVKRRFKSIKEIVRSLFSRRTKAVSDDIPLRDTMKKLGFVEKEPDYYEKEFVCFEKKGDNLYVGHTVSKKRTKIDKEDITDWYKYFSRI